ncbi:hypothetical protein ACFVJS_08355 [Nocardioides sp. NPDC057772]|uniref:hypothetical protein n=1 Tax=Nocardioides sp. NPDC057772 TaxID=3346245 RepID=UPI003671F947
MNDKHPSLVSCHDDTIVSADPATQAIDNYAAGRTSAENVDFDVLDVIAIDFAFETGAQTIDFPIKMPLRTSRGGDARSPSRNRQADQRNDAIT